MTLTKEAADKIRDAAKKRQDEQQAQRDRIKQMHDTMKDSGVLRDGQTTTGQTLKERMARGSH